MWKDTMRVSRGWEGVDIAWLRLVWFGDWLVGWAD